jgi:hypothetical protein
MMYFVFAKKNATVCFDPACLFLQPNMVLMGLSKRNNSASLNLLTPKIALTKNGNNSTGRRRRKYRISFKNQSPEYIDEFKYEYYE